MTTEEMLEYANHQIETCEGMVKFFLTQKVDREALRINATMLDFYKSVLPLIKEKLNKED